MPDPSSPMNRLRRVARALADGTSIAAVDAEWLVAGVTRYEAGAGRIGLDVALGLGAPGKRGWWSVERQEARDAALAAYWRERLPDLPDNRAAEEIARLARRGAASLHPVLCHGAIPEARQLLTILRKSVTPANYSGVTS